MTTRVGVIGWPLGHSVSPAMHNAAFAALGLAWRYDALPVPPEQLAATIRRLVADGYRGANVTIPHKEAVMPLMDELSAAAQGTGAVNTIVVQPDGRLVGENTDWLGFLHPLDRRGFDLPGSRVLLLGAGGAARGVAYALGQRGVREVAIWNRSAARASDLAAHIGSMFSGLRVTTGHDLRELVSAGTSLVVNTTPAGMWPEDDVSPWPDAVALPAGALAYDLVYRPEQTRFLHQAEQAGCPTQGGLDMLVVQGALAFELWTGQWPPLEVMTAVARESALG